MGREITLGKFPFVDFFCHYGPLTAFTSGVGIWVWDSLVPETVICATGYAVAIFLIYWLTRVYVSNLAGFLTALLGVLLLARFYKWYYWLFPMLSLYCFHRALKAREHDLPACFFWAGILDGVAGLYRLDLGLACACFHLICFSRLPSTKCKSWKPSRILWLFILGAGIPLFVWLSIICLKTGLGGIRDYFVSSVTGAAGAAWELGLPMPVFDLTEPLSASSGTATGFVVLAITYILGIWQGCSSIVRGTQAQVERAKFALGASILGLGIMPQALYRPDAHHLLQVLPPALIVGGISLSSLWQHRIPSHERLLARLLPRTLAITYLMFAALGVLALRSYGGVDQASWHSLPFQRYQELAEGLTRHHGHVLDTLVSTIRERTNTDDCVLVAGNMPQVYFFAKRPAGGLLTFYVPGILTDVEWRIRDLQLIEKNQPTLLVAPIDFFSLEERDWFHRSRPELYKFLRNRYTDVICQKDGWAVFRTNSNSK